MTAIIGDERTEEAFTAPAGEVERLFYGFSVFHCLPVGMVPRYGVVPMSLPTE